MRTLPIRAATLIGLAVVTGGVWLYGQAQGERSAKHQLPGPPDRTQWVPFSAKLERVTPNGTRFVGRFYRRSDGSLRHEAGYTWNQVERININNLATATNYKWDPNRGWVAYAMQLPPGGWRPGSPTALMLARLTPSADIEGLGILSRERDDYVEYFAPQLDMFPIKMEWKSCTNAPACGTWHTNIKIGQPPDELFEPQPGDPIERSSKPGGIYVVK